MTFELQMTDSLGQWTTIDEFDTEEQAEAAARELDQLVWDCLATGDMYRDLMTVPSVRWVRATETPWSA